MQQSEWIIHMNEYKVYAVDFDGTLSLGEWPEVGPMNEELIHFLRMEKRKGNKIILWTCREHEPLEAAVRCCRELGLEFDAVNDNLPENIVLYGNNSRKISCDYYIDDRMLHTAEWKQKLLLEAVR